MKDMLPMEDRVLLNNTLEGLQLDADVIADIMGMLDTRAESLQEARGLAPVPAGWFGDSHTGGYRLATNAGMARDAAVEEFDNLIAGLRSYALEIKAIRDDVVGTDEAISDHLVAVTNTADCTAVPTIGAGQCTVPTTNSEG
ncbi:hypothetical protein [Nocardioides sp. InS609-2]|uniref:hypothetical protein n=1 Tax=Nocardioides sp. InS609-2 TaxID=2760705 RepID=UPI0020BF31DD|nr:hypothetical protein [Nocardioides sp. InS609-2]